MKLEWIRFSLFAFLAMLMLSSTALAVEDASNVLLVVNKNDSTDTDNNGEFDWEDIISCYSQYHPTWPTSNVCSLATKCYDKPEAPHVYVKWSRAHYDIDTSAYWTGFPEVNLPAGEDYIIQGIAAWFDADSANRWGKIDNIALVKGMPAKFLNNWDDPGDTITVPWTAGAYQPHYSSILKSLDAAVQTFLHPGLGSNGTWTNVLNGRWIDKWYSANASQDSWEFVPGEIYNITLSQPYDTAYQWVQVSRLDAHHVDYVREMIRKASRPVWRYNPSTDEHEMDHWAVIDNASWSGYRLQILGKRIHIFEVILSTRLVSTF